MFTDKAFRRQVLSQTERPLQHKAMLYFAAARPKITRLRFDSIPADRVIVDPQTVGRDTIALWFNVPSSSLPDTIKGEITYFKHDTVNQLQEVTEPLKLAWRLIETKEQEREREKLERERRKAEAAGEEWVEPKKENPFAFKMPTSGEINPENHLTVDFDYPLVKLDSAELLLTRVLEDNSIEDIPVRMVRDTGMLRRWQVRAPWKLGGQYTLTIPEGAITDVAGLSNDSIIRKYTVLDPEKFATVLIHVRGRDDGTKYIVQLLDGSNALKQEKRDDRRHPVQLRSRRRDQVPRHRGPQRQRQVGFGQCGRTSPARAGRDLRQRPGRGHLRHEDQLGDRILDGHEPDLRAGHDAVALAPAGRTRVAASAPRGGETGQGGSEARSGPQPAAERQ